MLQLRPVRIRRSLRTKQIDVFRICRQAKIPDCRCNYLPRTGLGCQSNFCGRLVRANPIPNKDVDEPKFAARIHKALLWHEIMKPRFQQAQKGSGQRPSGFVLSKHKHENRFAVEPQSDRNRTANKPQSNRNQTAIEPQSNCATEPQSNCNRGQFRSRGGNCTLLCRV